MTDSHSTYQPRGGQPFAHMTYIMRVHHIYCKPGTKPQETEAILVKRGEVTDLEAIEIHTPTKVYDSHPALIAYLTDHAVSPFGQGKFFNPWRLIEVLVEPVPGNFWSNSEWMQGQVFKRDSDLPIHSEPTYMITPPPAQLPRGGVAYGLATYQIRHTPNKMRVATMRFQSPDDVSIVEESGSYFPSLTTWHLKERSSIAEDDALNTGSPWSYIDVLVGGEWQTGCSFLAFRHPAKPGDDGPVPRCNTDAFVKDESDEPVLDVSYFDGPAHRAFTDYAGMDKPYQVRFKAPEGCESTWSGAGIIKRTGTFENAQTKCAYATYTIIIDGPEEVEANIQLYAETGMRAPPETFSSGEAWDFIEVLIDDEWVPGVIAAKELFNISVMVFSDTKRREVYGFSNKYFS